MRKTNTLRIFLFTLMLGFCTDVFAHVELDYPQGGETFIVGQTVTVQWHVAIPHVLINWDLFYSSDGGVTWDTLQMNIPPEQLTYAWEVPDELTSTGKIRIWMDNDGQDYVDISGNFTIALNTMPPDLDAPANDTLIECNAVDQQVAIQNWLNNHGGMEVTNFCGEVIWSHDYTGLEDGCGAAGSTDVTFTATDECGFIESDATLTISDTQSPSIGIAPADMVVESDGNGNLNQFNTWLNTRGGGQATDACSNVTWTHNDPGLSDGCGATGSATVDFTASDACGNNVTATATFTILDRIAPAIQLNARDTILECGASDEENAIQDWLENNGGAYATDLNGIVSWSHNYSGLSDGCGITGNATVIFTASDVCGNIKSTTSSVSVVDTLGFQLTILPQDITVDCEIGNVEIIIQNWLNDHGGAMVNNLCGEAQWLHNFPNLPDTCGAPNIYVVSFTAVDECGHFISSQAMVTILDSLETGILNFDEGDFRLFPNPVHETLTIDFSNKDLEVIRLTLFNSFGTAVWSSVEIATQTFIPVNIYPPGVYFLLVQSSHSSFSRKVIIN